MNERIRTTAVPPLPGGAWQRHGVSPAHLQGRLTWPPLWVSSALPDATSFPPLLASPLPTCASQASVLGDPGDLSSDHSQVNVSPQTPSMSSEAGLWLPLDPQAQCDVKGSQPSAVRLLLPAGPSPGAGPPAVELLVQKALPRPVGSSFSLSFVASIIDPVGLTFTALPGPDCFSSPPWAAA